VVFCCVHSHIWIESIFHFMPVCDVHLYSTVQYSTGHIVLTWAVWCEHKIFK